MRFSEATNHSVGTNLRQAVYVCQAFFSRIRTGQEENRPFGWLAYAVFRELVNIFLHPDGRRQASGANHSPLSSARTNRTGWPIRTDAWLDTPSKRPETRSSGSISTITIVYGT